MADDSGRLVLLWGPLLLVGVLIVVFRFAETDPVAPASPETEAVRANAHPSGRSPEAAGGSLRPGWEIRPPDDGYDPGSGYPMAPPVAGPAPCWGAPMCPPWTALWWHQPFPRPGDHSNRYWGAGAPEWGPPLGEYGPSTGVDPYWWVPPQETVQ